MSLVVLRGPVCLGTHTSVVWRGVAWLLCLIRYVAHGEWDKDTAGGCTNNSTCSKNPQFLLQPKGACDIVIQLQQRDTRGSKHKMASIGASLLDKKGKRVKCVYVGQTVMETGYCNRREVRGCRACPAAVMGCSS